jgi:hypothetical protein
MLFNAMHHLRAMIQKAVPVLDCPHFSFL